MALAAATTWEIRTTGADTNGGGFVTGASGTDRSQQDAAFASGTDLAVHASTNTYVKPDSSYTPVSADIGNLIQITAGTGWTTGFYQITGISSGYWTLDRSPAATGTTGGTYAMGGALATPPSSAIVASNTVFIKAGTYTTSTGFTFPKESSVRGYGSTRDDCPSFAAMPVVKASANSITLLSFSAERANISYLCADGNGYSSITGFGSAAGGTRQYCKAVSCNIGFSGGYVISSVTSNCKTGASSAKTFLCNLECGSIASSVCNSGGSAYYCVIRNATNGIATTGDLDAVGCAFYNISGNAIHCIGGFPPFRVINCVFVTVGGYAISTAGAICVFGAGNATYNCTSGFASAYKTQLLSAPIVLTANPFVDAANGDYNLNNVAGGGKDCRAAGIGPVGQTSSIDIGAVQHADAGGVIVVEED